MGIQQRARGRWATVVVAITVSVTLALAGCGGGGGKKSNGSSQTKSSASRDAGGSSQGSSSPTPDPTATLAQIKGEKNMVVTVNEASRDSGGFVTVKGTITNNGTSVFNAVDWQGNELAVASSGASVAGAVLVDLAGKKRYYVLRDTDGKCLCTMGLTGIRSNETRPFFAQFPAPPASTTQVQFQLPTMPPANIEISEG
ncbi:hypothetical protein [Actinacidiphila soli]|uniref:hypothetical protein n=1 Tax=Actinacidiphila soli TaxID=2487275 RepID=UPI000FCC2ACB|nr:hypothetical protein [Actinacidiphila soli]